MPYVSGRLSDSSAEALAWDFLKVTRSNRVGVIFFAHEASGSQRYIDISPISQSTFYVVLTC